MGADAMLFRHAVCSAAEFFLVRRRSSIVDSGSGIAAMAAVIMCVHFFFVVCIFLLRTKITGRRRGGGWNSTHQNNNTLPNNTKCIGCQRVCDCSCYVPGMQLLSIWLVWYINQINIKRTGNDCTRLWSLLRVRRSSWRSLIPFRTAQHIPHYFQVVGLQK